MIADVVVGHAKPAGQTVHAPCPATLNLPALHAVDRLLDVLEQANPAEHGVQAAAPSELYEPTEQGTWYPKDGSGQ